jgi:uncharacterized membrane protein
MLMFSRQRLRLWWEGAFWLVPMIGVVAGWLLDLVSVFIDEALYAAGTQGAAISPAAAITLLAAIGGGMVTFTGFVFSVVLLVLQFGSTEYSPRTVAYFLRSRTIQVVLAIFLATIVFTTLSVLEVGSQSRDEFVPVGSVSMAILLLLASLTAFLVLLNQVGVRIRVDTVLSDIGRQARHQLRDRFGLAGDRRAERLARVPPPAPDARLVRFEGRPGQVIAADVGRLVRLARRRSATVTLMLRVGDAVSTGSHVALVSGADVGDREVSRCLLTASERSLRYDPLYGLRILSDVALRALSPGINDPTTAVRALDEVEGVLRTSADLPLGPLRIVDGGGRVVVPSPTWTDIVDLALLEVVEAGLSQIQVVRRLTALLNDLLADLPEPRHPPLLRYKRRLSTGVSEQLTPEYRSIALTGDRQGIGGSR